MSRKVLLIGIDGGELNLIKDWKSVLPNLARLMDNGVYGELESTIPPITCPAWNCLFTGKNPGKIGLYNFLLPVSGPGHRLQVASYLSQRCPSLWDLLSNEGRKVGIVNVPTSYPPKAVNGFMVSGGLLTPLARDVEYTYPLELKKTLNQVVKGYEIMPVTDLTIPGLEDEYLDRFHSNIEKQVAAVEYLMETHEWDFLCYVFFVTDSVQHYFWHHMSLTHPRHDPQRSPKYSDAIKAVYQKVDAGVGALVSRAPSDTVVFVVSDHGFQEFKGLFMVNEWLKEQGLIRIGETRGSSDFAAAKLRGIKSFLLRHGNPGLVDFLVRYVPRPLLRRLSYKGRLQTEGAGFLEQVDWSATTAYSVGENGGIYLNREFNGEHESYERDREKIANLLENLTDENGQKIPSRVWLREEIYAGPYVDQGPDLQFALEDFKYVHKGGLGKGIVWEKASLSGTHRRFGTFIAAGPGITKGGEVTGLRIYDVTPTILHLLGCPIPVDSDGRILLEILDGPFKASDLRRNLGGVSESERVRGAVRTLKAQGRL